LRLERSTNRRCVPSSPNSAVAARRLTLPDGEPRQPLAVEGSGLGRRLGLGPGVDVGVDDGAGPRRGAGRRPPGDQELHDLRRALEDPADAEVSEDLLGRDRLLAPGLEGRRRLESPASPDLDHLVSDLPGHLRAVQLGQGGLDADGRAARRRPAGWTAPRRLPRRRSRPAMKAIFSATASCLPIGMPHCTRSLAPLPHDLEGQLRGRSARGGERQAPGV